MALMWFKDEKSGPGKQWMGKAAVRAILEKRDEKYGKLAEDYDRLHDMFVEANQSARHRWLKMHEGFSRIEKLEQQRKWLIVLASLGWLGSLLGVIL